MLDLSENKGVFLINAFTWRSKGHGIDQHRNTPSLVMGSELEMTGLYTREVSGQVNVKEKVYEESVSKHSSFCERKMIGDTLWLQIIL